MKKRKIIILSILFTILLLLPLNTLALDLDVNLNTSDGASLDTVGLLILMTILTFIPSILMTMTSFTRFLIVFSFLRTAMGTQSVPTNQILVGLSLIMTIFIYSPTLNQINENAYQPYVAEEIDQTEALDIATNHMKEFMVKYTRTKHVELFLEISNDQNTYDDYNDIPLTTIMPAYIISEITTAFQIGFMIFLPFLIIDIVVVSILMAMGMFMMPPTLVALPFKIMLFILVDGWALLIESMIRGMI